MKTCSSTRFVAVLCTAVLSFTLTVSAQSLRTAEQRPPQDELTPTLLPAPSDWRLTELKLNADGNLVYIGKPGEKSMRVIRFIATRQGALRGIEIVDPTVRLLLDYRMNPNGNLVHERQSISTDVRLDVEQWTDYFNQKVRPEHGFSSETPIITSEARYAGRTFKVVDQTMVGTPARHHYVLKDREGRPETIPGNAFARKPTNGAEFILVCIYRQGLDSFLLPIPVDDGGLANLFNQGP